MKKLYFIFVFCILCFTNHVFSEIEQLGSLDKLLSIKEGMKNEWNLPSLDFEKLASEAGDQKKLLPHLNMPVKELSVPCKELGLFKNHKTLVITPITQGKVFINGVYCHVGNYARTVIITVLEGAQFGLQTTMTYQGRVLSCNYVCFLDNTYAGIFLRHEYPDVTVITGSEQVIIVR